MQYLLLVYIDPELLEQVPEERFCKEMRECLQHSDAMMQEGSMLGFQQLEPVDKAKTVRQRGGRMSVLDGPFAETKEVLAGYNLIEAASHDEALRVARELPWSQYGCIEVRPVADIAAMRRRVGA